MEAEHRASVLRLGTSSPAGLIRRRARRALRLFTAKPLGTAMALVIVILISTAVLADFIAPYSPYSTYTDHALEAPGGEFFFGTDEIGRDLLSRVIFGARISLWVGIVAVGLGTLSGAIIGLVSGYCGGLIDLAIQRAMDTLMAFPTLVLAMAMVAVLGSGITNVMIAIAIIMTPSASRIVRSAVLATKENQYIEAARCIGCRGYRIVALHILPNVTAPIIVIATLGLGNAILVEASLSFLGLGTPPPTPSWGGMLSGETRRFMIVAPWLAILPGLAISVTVLAFNLLGDVLRDTWDPWLRGTGRSK